MRDFDSYVAAARVFRDGTPMPIWGIPGGDLNVYLAHLSVAVFENAKFFHEGLCQMEIAGPREFRLRKQGRGLRSHWVKDFATKNLLFEFYLEGPGQLTALDSLLPFSKSYHIIVRCHQECFEQSFHFGRECAPGNWRPSSEFEESIVEAKLSEEFFPGHYFDIEQTNQHIREIRWGYEGCL